MPSVQRSCCGASLASPFRTSVAACTCSVASSGTGWRDSANVVWPGFKAANRRAAPRFFPPLVALHVVKLACELPAERRAGLSTWDCQEIARQLVKDGLCTSICADTVRRILERHELKPWRVHHWLSPQVPRDEAFRKQVEELCDLYTRPLEPDEAVLCFDEKTSIQPRPRTAPTTAAQPGKPAQPVRVEHEYRRAGAAQLFAAFDTRSGKVYGRCYRRKRQVEMLDFLEMLDKELPAHIKRVWLVLDNTRMHHGKEVRRWLEKHPRFRLHFLPVHCSWMNQVEQWFGVLTRKCLKVCDFDSLEELAVHIRRYIDLHNETAHPYQWSRKSFDKVLSKCSPPPSVPPDASAAARLVA